VVIVHHCGIEGTRPRGHSSLTGAADAQLAVKRDAKRQSDRHGRMDERRARGRHDRQ
jgi:hypothetical protein